MISEHIKRNTYFTFVFNLSDAESVYAALKNLQIDPRCARMLSSLLPGMCIFRQTQASWSNAFWCQIDYVEPARNIGQIEYDEHPFVSAITAEQTDKIIEQLYDLVSQHKTDINRHAKDNRSQLEQLAMKLIKLWTETPYLPAARLFERLGKLRFQTQIKIRKLLEKKGYASFEEIRIGRRTMLLMEVVDKGYNTLSLPVPTENRGRGSLAHRTFAHMIKSHFESKGYKWRIQLPSATESNPVSLSC